MSNIRNFAHIINGEVSNVIVADDAFVENHPLDWVECPEQYGIGDKYDANTKTFTKRVLVVPETVIQPWTKKEFMLKFTPVEYAAIKAAAAADATLDYYWTVFTVADNVLKTDPATIAGIQAFEAAGIIGTGRAAEILA